MQASLQEAEGLIWARATQGTVMRKGEDTVILTFGKHKGSSIEEVEEVGNVGL